MTWHMSDDTGWPKDFEAVNRPKPPKPEPKK